MVPSRRNGPSSTTGGWHVLEDQVEQRLHAVVVRAFQRGRHPALLGRAVEDREIELLVGGVERGEQVEHLVDHLHRARVGAIDLVDDDDGLEAHAQRLRHHELGLRQRAFGGIDQHQRAVHHVEDALDLAAEIGVARRVDDVDAGVLPDDRGRLGEDGDAALALEVVGIHRAFDLPLVLAVTPDCCSSRSTSVVLPWSTWAMMATLRRFMNSVRGCLKRSRAVLARELSGI